MEFIKADEIHIDDHPITGVDPKVKEALRASIKRHGTKDPLVVCKKETGRYGIIDGRTRFKIGMEVGIRKFRCIVVENVNIKPAKRESEK